MGEPTILMQLKKASFLLGAETKASRQEGLDLLENVAINEQDLPVNIVKGVARLSVSAAGLYKERSLQHHVRRLLSHVVTKQPDALSHLASAFSHQARPHTGQMTTTVSMSRYFIAHLEAIAGCWSVVLNHNSTVANVGSNQQVPVSPGDATCLAQTIAVYFSLSATSGNRHLTRRALAAVTPLWMNKDSLSSFCQALSAEEPSIHFVVTGGNLLRYVREHKVMAPEQLLQQLKQQLLQAYVKLLFQSKVKPSQLCLCGCDALLHEVTHQELSSVILPAVHKALLRNPEAVLTPLAHLARALSIDMSSYLADLSKLLQAPLHHKEDSIRTDTVLACGQLVRQCSDSASVTDFVNTLFDVYFGADGKLTVTTHKVSVLQAVEACSQHGVSSPGNTALLESVLVKWSRVMEAESHEGSLLQAMSAIHAWLARLGGGLLQQPHFVTGNMKKYLSQKTWTTAVRGAYFRCLRDVVSGATAVAMAADTVTSTIKAIEKALTQHTQLPLLVEALSGVSFLLALSAADCSLDNQLSSLWSSALDLRRGFFTSDKFLYSAPPEALIELCSVIEVLLLHHNTHISDNEATLLRCLCACLAKSGDASIAAFSSSNGTAFCTATATAFLPEATFSSGGSDRISPSAAVRQKAREVLKKLLASLIGAKLAPDVLTAFAKYLEGAKIEHGSGGGGVADGGGTSPEDAFSGGAALAAAAAASYCRGCRGSGDVWSGGVVSPAGVQHALLVLAHGCRALDMQHRLQLTVLALPVCCSPLVECERRGLWPMFCGSLQVRVTAAMQLHRDELVQLCTTQYKHSVTNSRVVSELFRVGGTELYPFVLPFLVKCLDDPLLLDITEEDYAIYNTPEGKLYHQHLVDDAFEINVDTKHVKKTTKVYTHKEQVMMLEEKKAEIERKRKEGRLELTPKQKEVMKTQMEKEAAIKKRVADILEGVPDHVSLLSACITGDSGMLAPFLTLLVPLLVGYMRSSVVGPTYARLYMQLQHSVIPREYAGLGFLVARTTVRLLGAAPASLPLDWCDEEAPRAALRALAELHRVTVPESSEILDEEEEKYLTAPAFVYCFPLLHWVLTHLSEVATDDSGSDEDDCDESSDQDEEQSDNESGAEPAERSVKEKESDRIACMGLQILSEHMCMRGRTDVDVGENSQQQREHPHDLYHPRLLPLQQLLALVIRVIGNSSGRTHSTACGVLCEVCACGSGGLGCHTATQAEITTLLDTLAAPSSSVRDAALRGLDVLSSCLPSEQKQKTQWLQVCHRLWVARHDESLEVKEQADLLWNKINMQVNESIVEGVRKDLLQPVPAVRLAAAVALASLLAERKHLIKKTISSLIATYKEKTKMTPAKRDQYDRIVEDAIDHWEGRSGVALALRQLAPVVEQNQVVQLVNFFVPEALGDRNPEVANNMLEAATALINCHGKDTVSSLLPIFEKCLKSAPNHASFDTVRQSVIILMGTLAKHLEPTNPKIKPIVAKLVEALSTPSQPVQEAVASCLHPLVPAIREDCPRRVAKLLTVLLESDNYGERRGAAYGLASLVKGMGILALKQLDIITKLTAAIQDKKNYKFREGALFGLEQLCSMLGMLFEPYIVHILPHLLLCFGDNNQHVRQAAKDTARAVMSKLSAHGVKLVLPSLLSALEEDSWRTKRGSVELLGNMAFCAPKQLSSCLPSVVPRLIDVLSDSHQRVQVAGAQALRLIGSVIKNPEIQAIVPVLLAALQDPGRNTSTCLQTLLHTKFVHFIDAPSLALIMPVVERAFEDRSTETRKMSAQIIGNMYSLTDQKDLTPYLPAIIPGLKASLLDPVPKVRSVSARALGAMVKGMGEASFEDLLPWLMQTLTSEASSVDRSGAAQGLAEVVGGLGPEKLHRLMPEIVATAERSDIAPHVKDGYIMMFIFLPSVFQDEFTPYIGQIIPPILNALADETEFVRDTALRAGLRIVTLYASTAIELLLPELETGLFHDNWRIRYSSIQLLGDLLYRISGVSGKMTTDTANEDDNFGTEQSQKAIMMSLGVERRNRVLAGLYMGRSDMALLVRQAALHVWKVVVTNTPKTLKEILPTLFTLLLGCLASTSDDKRQGAARTLGELVRKLGERVLPDIIPILEVGLESDDPDHRQGVCIGLSEIMANTSKDMVLCFTDNLVPTVRKALCDPLPAVREAAAQTFDALHGTIGQRALDETLPPLLALLKASDTEKTEEQKLQAEYALDGLKQIMAIKSKVVLPYLVPQLIAPPVNTEALCILASVAGDALTKHLDKILPALVFAVSLSWGEAETPQPQYEVALSHSHGVVLAVTDPAGVNIILDELLRSTKNKQVGYVRAAVSILVTFCSNTRADYSDHVPQLLRGLLQLFTSNDPATLQAAWSALNAVTKSLDASDQRTLVADVRQAVKFASSDLKPGQLMPGFCLPKGIQPILPIYREAILNGEPELKEAASVALTEVIQITSSESLKLSVISVTGPLIRILGDRFAPNVKVAVLNTIGLLLEKTGVMLKPFLPQLQTTFIKAIHDPHRGVRLRSGSALSHLVAIHLKPEPMFLELQNSVKTEEDIAVRETLIFCVRQVFTVAGAKVPDAVRKTIASCLVLQMETSDHDPTRVVAAGALASMLPYMGEAELRITVTQHFLECDTGLDWMVRHGRATALFAALKLSPDILLKVTSEKQVEQVIKSHLSSDRVPVLQSAAVATGYYVLHLLQQCVVPPHDLLQPFAKLINHASNEVKQSLCRSCQYLCESLPRLLGEGSQISLPLARSLVPALVNGTKEKNQVVKSAAEMALVALLGMKEGDGGAQRIVSALEGGMKDALTDCISRSLRRAVYYPVTEPEMDSTLLT